MFIKNFFSPSHMVKPDLVRGELPSAKSAFKRSLSIAWPSTVEAVLISLIGSVDTMMVGSLGSAAISAVGIVNQPKFIIMAAITTLNLGVTALVARRKGAGDKAGAIKCLKNCMLISIVLSLVLNALGFIFSRELLTLAGAKPDYIEAGIEYFRIILIGNLFSCISLTMTAAQRGYGNTRISMITNVTANVVNVIFNFFLINGHWIFPRLEVRGAAIATALGNLVAFLIALYSILRHDSPLCITSVKGWRADSTTIKGVGKVWSSALVEQMFMRIGFFTYASMVASLGTVEFATHQICMHIINLSFAFGDGLGIAATSLVGQSLGEKRPDLAFIYARVGQRCALIIGITLGILMIIFRRQILMLFTKEEASIALGMVIMIIISINCISHSSQAVISGCLRGSGDTKFVAFMSLICVGIVRPGVSYLLCYPLGLGLIGAWLGLYIDQLLRLIICMGRFAGGKWTGISL